MGDFNIDFDIKNYRDILPSLAVRADYEKYDFIINIEEFDKGDIENCIWKKVVPDVITNEYIQQEVRRVIRWGVWIYIKNTLLWIPPDYYFFLQYFNTGGSPPEFRLSRLKSVYYKLRVRNNPRALGTYTIKSRQIGETTIEMSNVLWEAALGNLDFGMVGLQSKTRDTVVRSCWRTLIMGWNGLPFWMKNALYGDFQNKDRVAQTMKFVTEASETQQGRDILIAYGAGSHNAFDSVNNMRRLILDEWNKWEEASPYQTFLNYEKFMATGTSRKGLISIFSSPADVETKYSKECYDFWKGSNPDELINGTTATRIYRYYASPLEGIEGFYDQYGDAEPNEIYDHIIKRRTAVPKAYQLGEIRAYPLCKEEMFSSFEGGQIWDNSEGIKQRKIFLIGAKFKDYQTKEPVSVYGNLEWQQGIQDSEVVFRQSDKNDFDEVDARFCFSFLPKNKEHLKDSKNPPLYVENVLGIDPFAKRHVIGKTPSNGAAVNFKFRDLHETGINKTPTMLYLNRPHELIFHEDMIRAAVFNRAMVQYENLNDKVASHFEDRGYHAWLLPSKGQKKGSLITGDAPSGRGAFLDEMVGLINSYTNTPAMEGMPYLLKNIWFIHLIDDLIAFNPKDTHANDAVMAFGQAIFGAAKLLHKKIRQPSEFNNSALNYLFG